MKPEQPNFMGLEGPLAAEIVQEAASPYFTACRKMVEAVEVLKAHDRTASAAIPGSSERRETLLAEAAERVFYVVIQREAMKLSVQDNFYDTYEIPMDVRLRLGPKGENR